jgi:hypothetical protein
MMTGQQLVAVCSLEGGRCLSLLHEKICATISVVSYLYGTHEKVSYFSSEGQQNRSERLSKSTPCCLATITLTKTIATGLNMKGMWHQNGLQLEGGVG